MTFVSVFYLAITQYTKPNLIGKKMFISSHSDCQLSVTDTEWLIVGTQLEFEILMEEWINGIQGVFRSIKYTKAYL